MDNFVLLKLQDGKTQISTGKEAEAILRDCARMTRRDWSVVTEYKNGKVIGEIVFNDIIDKTLADDAYNALIYAVRTAYKNAMAIRRHIGECAMYQSVLDLSKDLLRIASKHRGCKNENFEDNFYKIPVAPIEDK